MIRCSTVKDAEQVQRGVGYYVTMAQNPLDS